MKEKIKPNLTVLKYSNARKKLKMPTLLLFIFCTCSIAGENISIVEKGFLLNPLTMTERDGIGKATDKSDHEFANNKKTAISGMSQGNDELKSNQQEIVVSGRVVDQDGFPMPGVQVAVKERKGVGVVTDIDGKYTIKCSSNETLVFSFIGYISLEEKASEVNQVTVTLQLDIITLEEVQVVAFGKQKKESVVSSITTINPKELRVASSNMTTALAGKLAGVIAYQRSGEPGLDNAEFFIRGSPPLAQQGKRTR